MSLINKMKSGKTSLNAKSINGYLRPAAIYLSALVLVTKQVTALEYNADFSEFTSEIGKFFYELLRDEYSLFFFVIVVMTILMKGIYGSLMRKIKIFEGEGGSGLSSPGEAAAWSMSLLSVAAFVYMKGAQSVGGFLGSVLGPFGLYGAIIITIVLFLGFRHALESNKLALVFAGLAMIWVSGITGIASGMFIGMIILLVGLLFAVRAMMGRLGRLKPGKKKKKRAVEEEEKETKHAEDETEIERKVDRREIERLAAQRDNAIQQNRSMIQQFNEIGKMIENVHEPEIQEELKRIFSQAKRT